MPESGKPYISFVVVGRNDNYGGDFLHRAQLFTNVLITLCEKYRLNSELIIQEWNPPENNPRLTEALKWPGSRRYTSIRIIEVPNTVHRTLPNSEKMPLFEYVGKNVGIRRARGEYILATNPDIIFAEELVKYLSSKNLSQKRFYRATRYDIDGTAPPDKTPEEQIAYYREHIARINGYFRSYDNRLSRKLDIKSIFWSLYYYGAWRLTHLPFNMPFTNASGDFLMMHRSQWQALHGYPEVKGVASDGLHHADSFMLYMALLYGLKQVRLNNRQRIYHQKHGFAERPVSGEIENIRQTLLKSRKPVIVNDENWGLGKFDLPEVTIA